MKGPVYFSHKFSVSKRDRIRYDVWCIIDIPANYLGYLEQRGIEISVKNPVTHNTWEDGKYTTYEIAIETSNKAFCLASSHIRRRYSEFHWLRKKLKKNHPLISPPKLPSKKMFSERFETGFITERMKGLEKFLVGLIEEKIYMSDTTTHLFMQTDLPCKEIENYLSGNLTDEFIENVWKAGGRSDISSMAGSEDSSSISTSSDINYDEPSTSGFNSSMDASINYPDLSEVNVENLRTAYQQNAAVNTVRSTDHDFLEIIIPETESEKCSSHDMFQGCRSSSPLETDDITTQSANSEQTGKKLFSESDNKESSATLMQDHLEVSLDYSINSLDGSP